MKKTVYLVRTAIIAAIYATLTLALAPLSYASIQLRVSEALTILPLFFIEAVPGLAIGCLIANIASGPLDMIVGSLATLAAATLTFFSRKVYLGVIPPILINALVVPIIFLFIADFPHPYWFNVLTVGLGQMVAVLALGLPLYGALKPLTAKYAIFAPYKRKQSKIGLPKQEKAT